MSRKTLLSIGLLLVLVGVSLFQLHDRSADELGWALSALQRSSLREGGAGEGVTGSGAQSPDGAHSPDGAPDTMTGEAGGSRPATAPPVTDGGGPADGLSATIPDGATIRFEMDDPAGDDYGAGKLVYPSHKSFAPYRALFDLVRFSVWEGRDAVYFDVELAELDNVWNAPEGFSHALVDIYIDTGPGGATRPARRGPLVRFDSRYAWDVRLKVAPFGESRLFRAEAAGQQRPEPVSDGLRAVRLEGETTIRVEVSRRLLPELGPDWRYYVWVAGFDAFGDDGYREVNEEGGAWEFGGASSSPSPRVIDLLARGFGPRSQVRLLRGGEAGAEPVLVPVGPGAPGGWFPLAFPAAMLLLLAVIGLLFAGVLRLHRGGGAGRGSGGGGPRRGSRR